jgi:hypothetical protein
LVNSKPTTPGVEAVADVTKVDSEAATSRVDGERIVAFKWNGGRFGRKYDVIFRALQI